MHFRDNVSHHEQKQRCALLTKTTDDKKQEGGRMDPEIEWELKKAQHAEMVCQIKQDNGKNAMFCSWNQKNYTMKACVYRAKWVSQR